MDKSKRKKIIIDFVYSIFAYSLPTLALQLIIQPLLVRFYSDDNYGLYITLFSVVHLGINCLITPLSSLRLLKKSNVQEGNVQEGVFNFWFLIILFLNLIFTTALSYFYINSFRIIDLALIALLCILISIHDYYSVQFRLEINYKKIIIDNIILVSGYFIGFLLCRFIFADYWQLIFLVGYFLSSVFVAFITKLWRAKPVIVGFGRVGKEYAHLSFSSSLNNSLTYCDKLLIYPFLGGLSVSIYSAATVVSKLISFVASPIRNVMLSYVVDENKIIIKRKNILKKIIISIIALLLFYAITYFASLLLCYLLYNKYFYAVKIILIITVLSVLFETISNVLNVFLLKVGKARLQSIVSFIKVAVYAILVTLSMLFLQNKLMGFCLSTMFASFVQLVLIIILLKNRIEFCDEQCIEGV